jgi:CheY-like chemotaxis protein
MEGDFLMRILIAEDEYTSRTMLDYILEEKGHEVTSTVNGAEAWQALQLMNQGLKPDLCIMDLMMPVLDGRSLVEIMQRTPLWKNIRVITCSTRNEYHTRQDLSSMGTYGHICKPIDVQDVLAVIEKT